MNKLKRLLALVMALAVILCMPMTASANEGGSQARPTFGSINIYKYDLTGAEKDGVWDSSYVSTGVRDEAGVESILGGSTLNGDAYGYAIKGVVYSWLTIAEPREFTETIGNESHTMLLYGVNNNEAGLALLDIIGVSTDESVAAANTEYYYFFHGDTLVSGLKNALDTSEAATKNALEQYMDEYGGWEMDPTDEYGHTSLNEIPPSLILIVETSVPENVTETTAPFIVSIPMTSGDGSEYIYDVTLYPKNLTGEPSLDKTVRENSAYTGKNSGSDSITDGYAVSASASASDVVDYQIISTLPSITSEATYLSKYSFEDVLASGIAYRKNDLVISFYKDTACTDKITTWAEDSGKFSVTYDGNKMNIEMTETGLAEINSATTVYNGSSMVNSGYSGCTMRITYTGLVLNNAALTAGDSGNKNTVTLTWSRSNTDYSDTLESQCSVNSYGLELTKTFRDGKGDPTKAAFSLYNSTDGYYVTAAKNAEDGIYYVIGKAAAAENATRFIPNAQGLIKIKGLEDDSYSITELQTDTGYNILKSPVEAVISKGEASASATVSGKAVNMSADGSSANAYATLGIINTRGFDLPQTGSRGTWMFPVIGLSGLALAGLGIFSLSRKKSEN